MAMVDWHFVDYIDAKDGPLRHPKTSLQVMWRWYASLIDEQRVNINQWQKNQCERTWRPG